MSKEVMRYRLEHNTPAREVQPGRDINILRGTVMVTEADHGRVIDALLAERDALKAVMKRVYDGLNARIDDAIAGGRAVPIFDGIADLHDALQGEQP